MLEISPNKPLETAKHRDLVARFCIGDGLDLGSFTDPINSRAVRIDRDPAYCHISGDVADLSRFADNCFDYVHASHILEDFKDWQPVLDEWTRVLKPGGHLIVAVPDHKRFRAAVDAGQGDNFDHKHESYLGEIENFLPNWKSELNQFTSPDDYSIISVLRKPLDAVNAAKPERKLKVKTFGHSGDLGDVIYALPTIKALCERDNCLAEIVLYRGPGVRECFTVERAHNIGKLLEELPFVKKWVYWGSPLNSGDVDYDFQDWRTYYTKYCDNGRGNLARTPAEFFRVDPAVIDRPWITSIDPLNVYIGTPDGGRPTKRNVVVARSHRYRNPEFPWHELAARYQDRAVCIGIPSELAELANCYGFYASAMTLTLLDAARLIAGADLVISNQTSIYAIAEAMKKPCILERYEPCPNVDFDRSEVWSGQRVREFLVDPDPFAAADVPEPVAMPAVRGVKA